MRMHEDEIDIDTPLACALVARSYPRFARLPIRRLTTTGSSNVLFRLGDDLLVRLPRQKGASAGIGKEARWTLRLAPSLPVAVPEIVGIGAPAPDYPESWSLVRWIDGDVPTPEDFRGADRDVLIQDLADLVRAFGATHVPSEAREDPDLRWYRAEPLARMDGAFRQDLAACRDLDGLDLDLGACLRVWEDAIAGAQPAVDAPPHWVHGDLLAENLLVRDGRIAAVLDFGCLSIGDPAVDLVCAWELLDQHGRSRLRSLLDVDDPTWARGRGWALAIAMMTFPYYWRTMPERCRSRAALVREVLAGDR